MQVSEPIPGPSSMHTPKVQKKEDQVGKPGPEAGSGSHRTCLFGSTRDAMPQWQPCGDNTLPFLVALLKCGLPQGGSRIPLPVLSPLHHRLCGIQLEHFLQSPRKFPMDNTHICMHTHTHTHICTDVHTHMHTRAKGECSASCPPVSAPGITPLLSVGTAVRVTACGVSECG